MPSRPTFALVLLVGVLGVAAPVPAQQPATPTIQGDWLRALSNYNPNDQMRISVDGAGATITRVPPGAHAAFKVGVRLWNAIREDGSIQVRGSDGRFYPATYRLVTPDSLVIVVKEFAAGNEQAWVRAGPTIDGEWVRIAPGDPLDGLRLSVQDGAGIVGYLPTDAPATIRTGTRFWRGAGGVGGFRAMDARGGYRTGTVQFQGPDRLWLTLDGVATPELWVRPAIVEAVRAEGTRPAALACVPHGLAEEGTPRPWGWQLTIPDAETVTAEGMGLLDYRAGAPGSGNLVVDIEQSYFPGITAGPSRLWQRASRRLRSTETLDLDADAFDARQASERTEGNRPADIEVRVTASGPRFSVLWHTNLEGAAWEVDRDLTGAQLTAALQARANEGFRPVDIEGYAALTTTGGMVRYTAIWQRTCDRDGWKAAHGLDAASLRARNAEMVADGLRMVDVDPFLTPEGVRYTAVWQELQGRDTEVRFDQPLQDFLAFHRRYVDAGMRLEDFEVVGSAADPRYAGVWVEHETRYRHPARAALDDSLEAYRQRHNMPGLSMAVIRDGEVIYQRGVGLADSARDRAAFSGTIYPTASVAKVVGGVLAARLEARGVVDLRRSTRSYVDSLPDTHTHTLEQLLAKTACIRHYDEMTSSPETKYYKWRWDALRPIRDDMMLASCQPGLQYHYSTLGFTILGAALEAATGKDIVTLVQEEIAQPMGLRTLEALIPGNPANPSATRPQLYQTAAAYWWDGEDSVRKITSHEEASWKVLGGGLQSDALDLARFGWMTLAGGIVSNDVRDNRLWRSLTGGLTTWLDADDAAPSVGLAWNVGNRSGRRVAEHGGAGRGARTQLTVWRDDGLVIALMTNQQESAIDGEAPSIAPFVARLGAVVFAADP